MSIKEFKCNDYGFFENICDTLNEDAQDLSYEITLTVGRLINRIVLHTFDEEEETESMADVLKMEREIFECYNILEEIGFAPDCWDTAVHSIVKYGLEKYKDELLQIDDESEKQSMTAMVTNRGSNMPDKVYDLTYRLHALAKYNETEDKIKLVYKDNIEQIQKAIDNGNDIIVRFRDKNYIIFCDKQEVGAFVTCKAAEYKNGMLLEKPKMTAFNVCAIKILKVE